MAFLFEDQWSSVADSDLFTENHWPHRVILNLPDLHLTLGHHIWCCERCVGKFSSFRLPLNRFADRRVVFTFETKLDAAKFILEYDQQIDHK